MAPADAEATEKKAAERPPFLWVCGVSLQKFINFFIKVNGGQGGDLAEVT